MRHELGVMPGACLLSMRDEVSTLTHPPLSVDAALPGSSVSYLADYA